MAPFYVERGVFVDWNWVSVLGRRSGAAMRCPLCHPLCLARLFPLEWSGGDTTKECTTTTGERGENDRRGRVKNGNGDKLVVCGALINWVHRLQTCHQRRRRGCVNSPRGKRQPGAQDSGSHSLVVTFLTCLYDRGLNSTLVTCGQLNSTLVVTRRPLLEWGTERPCRLPVDPSIYPCRKRGTSSGAAGGGSAGDTERK